MSKAATGYSEFARGWPIILAAGLGIGLGLSPMPFYTIGMFAPQLAREFQWGFGDIMVGIMVMTIMSLIASPIVGHLADRYGVRKIALTSVVLFSLSFAGFALSTGSLVLFYINWGLMALLGAGTLPITWTRAVNTWFEKKKGLALGFSLIGTGLFGALIKPLTVWLIAELGWRGAYVAIAAMPLLIAFPVAWLLFRDVPPSEGSTTGAAKARTVKTGMSVGEVLKDYRFWILMVAVVPISFALGGPIPNMENLLATKGFNALEVASIVPVIGISVLVGRTVGGFLIDHLWAPGVAFVLLSLPALACWILAHYDVTMGVAIFSVFLIGFASGVEYDLLAYLVARYFGMKSYSTIYGFLYGSFALGAGSAPTVFGKIYDQTQSYTSILVVSMVILLIGAVMLLAMGRYRFIESEEEMVAATEEAMERVVVEP
ncbi:MFS transporter [Halioxenophilus sp. WMMB6]|uniref:MFS transporter n=1 Tax=Halioxenophilus sp. WMMB6 TaxID=3073815 RepID=UPI00295EFE2D|nr:MFS transporter [Halioxenophilus sp. WMMB6]